MHKFKVGQRVKIKGSYATTGYLKGGTVGTVQKCLTFFGDPEYLVLMDDNEPSNIADWVMREDALEAEDAS